MLTFAINYLQFKCVHLFEKIFIILSKPQCFFTRRMWNKQRSSLVNPTIVTKLQLFIRMKTELVYIGREELSNDDDVK